MFFLLLNYCLLTLILFLSSCVLWVFSLLAVCDILSSLPFFSLSSNQITTQTYFILPYWALSMPTKFINTMLKKLVIQHELLVWSLNYVQKLILQPLHKHCACSTASSSCHQHLTGYHNIMFDRLTEPAVGRTQLNKYGHNFCVWKVNGSANRRSGLTVVLS